MSSLGPAHGHVGLLERHQQVTELFLCDATARVLDLDDDVAGALVRLHNNQDLALEYER